MVSRVPCGREAEEKRVLAQRRGGAEGMSGGKAEWPGVTKSQCQERRP
jgi:hypothetical protein